MVLFFDINITSTMFVPFFQGVPPQKRLPSLDVSQPLILLLDS